MIASNYADHVILLGTPATSFKRNKRRRRFASPRRGSCKSNWIYDTAVFSEGIYDNPRKQQLDLDILVKKYRSGPASGTPTVQTRLTTPWQLPNEKAFPCSIDAIGVYPKQFALICAIQSNDLPFSTRDGSFYLQGPIIR